MEEKLEFVREAFFDLHRALPTNYTIAYSDSGRFKVRDETFKEVFEVDFHLLIPSRVADLRNRPTQVMYFDTISQVCDYFLANL